MDLNLPEKYLGKEYKEKIEKREISGLEERILKAVFSETDLGNIVIQGMIKVGDVMLILVEGNPGRLIGKNGRNIRRIEKESGARLRVVKKTGLVEGIADLIYPARILSVSKIFPPGGEKRKIKIVVSKEDAKKIPLKKEEVEEIIKTLYGEDIEIILE